MFWIGLIIASLGTVAFLFKLYVVWDVSRDLFNGGGVPTLDLPVIYPVFIAIGVSTLLKSQNVALFPYFGFVLWIAIVVVAIGLMWLFDKLGRPIRDAKLRAIESRKGDVRNTTAD